MIKFFGHFCQPGGPTPPRFGPKMVQNDTVLEHFCAKNAAAKVIKWPLLRNSAQSAELAAVKYHSKAPLRRLAALVCAAKLRFFLRRKSAAGAYGAHFQRQRR